MNNNNSVNMLDFNIQLFADTADNDTTLDETVVTTDNAGSDEEEVIFTDGTSNVEGTVKDETPNVDEKIASTKAFSNRLKQERQKIEKELEEKRLKNMDEVAVRRGFKNWKELEDFDKKEKIESIGISDADAFTTVLNDAIASNPTVMEARKVLETQKQKEQETIMSEAISEIHNLDSDINTVDDLLNLENYNDFYELVGKGYSLPDAYKVIAFDKIANKKATNAAKDVYKNIDSKGHLKTVSGTKTNEVLVPDEILAGYKKNLPNMTDDEIRKNYAKYIAETK